MLRLGDMSWGLRRMRSGRCKDGRRGRLEGSKTGGKGSWQAGYLFMADAGISPSLSDAVPRGEDCHGL